MVVLNVGLGRGRWHGKDRGGDSVEYCMKPDDGKGRKEGRKESEGSRNKNFGSLAGVRMSLVWWFS